MNTARCFLLGLGLIVPGVGWAQQVRPWVTPLPADGELRQLQEQRDRSLAAATVPIERQYRAALEKLLRVTMQRGDLDGANKVKKAIQTATGAASPDVSAGRMEMPAASLGDPNGSKRFAGTQWMRARIKITFGADGAFVDMWGNVQQMAGTWKAKSPTAVLATSSDGKRVESFQWKSDQAILRGEQHLTPYHEEKVPPPNAGKPAAPGDGDVTPGGEKPFGKP